MPITILLIDDHSLFRSGLRALLLRTSDFNIVGEAGDGSEGIKLAKKLQPDVILLDLNMPGLSGLEVLSALSQDTPNSAVIILTVSEDTAELKAALAQGAKGYLIKNIETKALKDAIYQAKNNVLTVSPAMTKHLLHQLSQPNENHNTKTLDVPLAPNHDLSKREMEVVQHITAGLSNKEIAKELSVTESTIKIHVQSILKKLHLNSGVQVAVYAIQQDLIQQT